MDQLCLAREKFHPLRHVSYLSIVISVLFASSELPKYSRFCLTKHFEQITLANKLFLKK